MSYDVEVSSQEYIFNGTDYLLYVRFSSQMNGITVSSNVSVIIKNKGLKQANTWS